MLTGDSVHCFGDGVLIASAFIADLRLGWWPRWRCWRMRCRTTSAIWWCCARPPQISELALFKVSLAGTMTALGGLAGWWLVDPLHGWLPYFLVLATSSFMLSRWRT